MQARIIEEKREFNLKKFFLKWEFLLLILLIGILIMNSLLSEGFLNFSSIMNSLTTFLDKSFMVLPMVFIIILGDIDISVASTAALSSVIMAVAYNAGVPMPFAIILSLIVGILSGFINGFLITRFKELSAVIVTLSTMTIYRGIAYMILKDQAAGNFPEWFSFLGWGSILGIPVIVLFFIVFATAFWLLLHKTTFGREIYAMGKNITASKFSGIKIDRNKVIVFTLAGLMAAITGVFLTSRMGSARPNIAVGYELDVIAMVVLGGISSSGGKGKMIGAILAIFIIGFLRYGLGLVNIPAQTLMIIIGLLLIVSVSVSNIKLQRKKKL